jgi:transposase
MDDLDVATGQRPDSVIAYPRLLIRPCRGDAWRRRIRELSNTIKALQREIAQLVGTSHRSCSQSRGSSRYRATLVGEVAGPGRFASDAKLARGAGVAPIPVSSGNTNRHRLDRGGNRQINAAITASLSPACAATPRRRTTSPANASKAKHQRSDPPPHRDLGTPPSPSPA